MAVSLGVRLTGLFVAGALVIAAAAACGGGGGGKGDQSDTGGSGGTSVAGGVSSGGQDSGGTGGGMSTWHPQDGDSSSESGASGGSEVSDSSSGGRGRGSIEGPGWLPFGPHSPNTNESSDPESVYDDLSEHPGTCRETAKKIPAEPTDPDPYWQVIRGLAEACQAVQGQGGSWDTAAADYAAVQGRLTSCKGRAAYAVLGGVLQFHRQHPSVTRKLKASTSVGDADACDFQIVFVDVGGDGEAQPCDTLTIKLAGIYFHGAGASGARAGLTSAESTGLPSARG